MKLPKARTSALVMAVIACIGSIYTAADAAAAPKNLDTVEVRPPPGWDEEYLSYNRVDGGPSLIGRIGIDGVGAAPVNTAKEQETDDGKRDCNNTKGNPVVLYTGNKIEPELDFASRGELGLYLERTYNHQWSATGLFGNHWLSNFDFSLAFSNSEGLAWMQRPDGRRLKLIADGSQSRWNEDKAQPVAYLARNPDGTFTFHNESRGLEVYDAGGYILRLQNEQGVSWSFAYTAGYLQSVTHSSGRKIQFTWNGDQVVQVTDPAGTAYRYTYTANAFDYGRSRLASVTLPGSPQTTVSYHYEDARYPGGLTGKSYNGVRYSYFAYDDQQRAILSEHAGNVERHTFSYQVESTEPVVPPPAPVPPGGLRPLEGSGWCDYRGGAGRFCYPSEVNNQSRMARAQATASTAEVTRPRPIKTSVTETNPLGRKTTYAYEDGNQVSVTGDTSPRCPASYKERSFDPNGYPNLESDFADNLTDYDYSPGGFLLKRVEAVGTSAERTTLYEWDMAANRPLKQTVVGDHETSFTYEGRGNIASITRRNLTSHGVPGQSRTTTYSYTYHPNGLKASLIEDGPLPQDTLTYTFDSLGNLTSASNALGHTITYGDYTGLGEPGRITSVVGGITTISRDERGRVTSRREPAGSGWATTSIAYDGTGNVARVTLPNGVTTNFEYDAARRLMTEVRSLGDGTYAWTKHSYDAASNRTRTEVSRTDFPQGSTIIGSVDGVTYRGNWEWYIPGWACSTGSATPVRVDVYAETGELIGSVQANGASGDAATAACQSGGAHRFEVPITLAQRQQLGGKRINAYGISPRGAEYTRPITNSGSFTVPMAATTGAITGIGKDANWNHYVEGWACSVGVSSSIDVHLYVGGPSGTGTFAVVAPANLPSDASIGNACQTQGRSYSFRIPLTNATRDAYDGKPIYVHGISVVASQPSNLLTHSGGYTVPGMVRSADLVSFTASPNHVLNGEQSTLTAQFRNTGNFTWAEGTYLAWGTTSLNQPLGLSSPVAPGGIATFQWSVSPHHEGSGSGYNSFMAKMADGRGAWGQGGTVQITVENPNVYCPPNKPFCEDPK